MHLTFEDPTALGYDSSGSAKHFIPDSTMCTAVVDPQRCNVVRCNTGTAVSFRSLFTPGVLSGESAMTVCFWWKEDATGGTCQILNGCKNGGSWAEGPIFIYPHPDLLSGSNQPGKTSPWDSSYQGHVYSNTIAPVSNTWTHIASARNTSGKVWLWINGTDGGGSGGICNTGAINESSPCSNGSFNTIQPHNWTVINGLDNTPNYPMGGQGQTGHFDDFRIYNRVLSDDEVQEIYEKTKAP